jgi:hypothetical protein
VLAYGFTENCQFAAKTDRNSVFCGCDPHFLDRIYLMSRYMSFYRFSKNQNFSQNPYVLAYGFTENHQFKAKIDRNCVFLSRDPHILDQLYLMAP